MNIKTPTERVQYAWNRLQEYRQQIKQETDSKELESLVNKCIASTLILWTTIADVTKSINPTLRNDIDRRPNSFKHLNESDICWMDKVWKVKQKACTRCSHCGKTHYDVEEMFQDKIDAENSRILEQN